MRAITFLVIAAGAAACVKGNPLSYDNFTGGGSGGTLAIAGCGYSVTTPAGVEAPKPSGDVFGSDATPQQIHLTLMSDPKTSVVAQWRTADDATTEAHIRYAQGASLTADQLAASGTDVPGYEFAYVAGNTMGQNQSYIIHQGHLCSLAAGTTYSYQVGAHDPFDNSDHWSDVYTFHTAPDVTANPDAEVQFAFVGDSRGGYDIWGELVGLIQGHAPDLVLYSGDAVTLGVTQYEWDEFFTAGQPLFATTPMVYAEGNHELNAPEYFAQIAVPVADPANMDHQTYGTDYGWAHVTVANDSPNDPTDITTAIKSQIQTDFTASMGARWKLFMHHQPMWSASTMHGSNITLQQYWEPLVDAAGIDLVLNGHDHDYEVSKPLTYSGTSNVPTIQTTNATGTVFVVAGGAGAELYQNGNGAWTAYSESTYSAAIIDVQRDSMTMNAFRQDGTPINATGAGFSKTKQ